MEAYEKLFLWFSIALLAILLAALAYTTLAMHVHVPGDAGMIEVKPGQNLAAAVLTTSPFDHPGLRKLGPNRYEAVMFAQAWSFYPREIEVPAGAEVTFRVTSVDVTHGFFIPGTRVNMMVIPGLISVTTYRFERRGKYLLLCHEYCGLLHHTMNAEVEVE